MEQNKFNIIAFFLFFAIPAVLGFSAYSDLSPKNETVTVYIDECYEAFSINHTVGGLIPIGKDTYYLAYDNEHDGAFFIKASKKWYSDNFSESGYPSHTNRVSLTSIAKNVSSAYASIEMDSVAKELEGVNFLIDHNKTLIEGYKSLAIYKIADAIFGLLLAAFCLLSSKNDALKGSPLYLGFFILMFIYLAMSLKLLASIF
ncbi:MAG: hypothetical protein K6G88_03385 [Lachnospiraceae bacterium]|nr:hypothetical protein [Lachnospiraceae bacterium]